jgi:hypothetical protein
MVTRLAIAAGAVALALGAVVGCESDAPPPTPATPPAPALEPEAIFVRASLDVRGVRPRAAELAELTSGELDAKLGVLVDDARFGERVRAIFAPAVRTRRDEYRFMAAQLGLDEGDDGRLQRAFAEEVLNVIHYVAVSDRPMWEIFTVDFTIVDPILLDVWPLEEVEADDAAALPPGTVMARYTDGRPVAGVLATNAFFWRHTSTIENGNRGRTNAISRAFLCEDFLERPIDFPTDVDLTNSEDIKEAVRENDGCTACHATMDPFASHLWGFMQTSEDPIAWSQYHPENELMWQTETLAEPAFYGTPTSGALADAALYLAADERFVSCTVQRMYEAFLGRPVALGDEGQLAAHRESFVASGLSLKALARSLLADPAYRGESALSAFGGRPEPVSLKLVSPDLLASSLFELSGYELRVADRAVTDVDFGVRALAGGSERGASTTPSLGRALVHRRLAEASARALTDGASVDARLGALLGGKLGAPPSAELVSELAREITSQRFAPDGDEVAGWLELWDEVAADENVTEAWTALLTALFADPALAVY